MIFEFFTASDLHGAAGRCFLDSLLEGETLALYDALELHTALKEIDRRWSSWASSQGRRLAGGGRRFAGGARRCEPFSQSQAARFLLRAGPQHLPVRDARAFHGRITKRGRAQARWLLIEAAEHLRKSPGPCAVSISAWRKNARRCPLDCALAPQPPPLRKKRKR